MTDGSATERFVQTSGESGDLGGGGGSLISKGIFWEKASFSTMVGKKYISVEEATARSMSTLVARLGG